ncbi:hypothetical protein CHS0354_026340 [Potamilus streckersoni]|uniref:Mitochondrial import inner membrane translocase subunit n=1 Tax=Potamilus streckersoni TaxID=2493646 RepID=A0AAE0W787_9BIVA|nr:hypothetical protein CHS0354_026340 [Potamilus streckersoni]
MSVDTLLNDPRMKQFIEAETQKQRFHALVQNLSNKCWDSCIDRPASKLDSKTESCLLNCVNRFIDSSNYIVRRLDKQASVSDVSEME